MDTSRDFLKRKIAPIAALVTIGMLLAAIFLSVRAMAATHPTPSDNATDNINFNLVMKFGGANDFMNHDVTTPYNTDAEDFFEEQFELRKGVESSLAHAWVLWSLACCSLLLGGIALWWFFIFGRQRCCNRDGNDKQCLHDCCKCNVSEPDCAERIARCRRDRHMTMYGRTALAFSIALVAIQIIAMSWAKLVTGMWTNLSFLNDMPNILIASFAITSIYAVTRYMKYTRARSLILLGLSLVALEVLLEVIVKKYVAIRGFSRADDWFFLFGAVEFIGIIFVLVGIAALLGLTKRKNI